MTNDLKPCPFCGGAAHASLAAYASGATAHALCDGCGAAVLGYGRGERGLRDAVKRWNRRAERTCRYVRDHMGAEGNWFCKCSECGAEFDERVVDRHFVFCPNCGALVIGEETGDAD